MTVTETSNIRKLLCDSDLGLIPHLEKCLKDLHSSAIASGEKFKVEPYDIELKSCHTQKYPNDQKPIVTQSVLIKIPLTGEVQDKMQLYLIATELQNQIDIKIIDWSALERRQYDIQGIPLKQPITKIDGEMNYELVFDRPNYCCITLCRQFDLSYAANF
ncbi:hypothetical protein NDI47_09325 [Microcoleus vaginatus GB1-A2]|uniref:hypothetical protein n=1 Tax=Microcoleus vaginatus TaxID=119532 RepID=UPI001682BD5C|nr:hypothetical protein [Microcoleus sp. FACHB-61]